MLHCLRGMNAPASRVHLGTFISPSHTCRAMSEVPEFGFEMLYLQFILPLGLVFV